MVNNLLGTDAYKHTSCHPLDPDDPWVKLYKQFKKFTSMYNTKHQISENADFAKRLSSFKHSVVNTWF